jgi:hypothetical protein
MLYLTRPNVRRWALIAGFFILAVLVVLIGPHVRPASAQSTSPLPHFFTTSPTADGVVVVDQSTGYITYCTNYVQKKPNLAGVVSESPAGQCASIGKITASPAAVGNFVPNLTVITQSPSLYVINNITGQIVQCATVNTIVGSTSSASGYCIAQGAAAQSP